MDVSFILSENELFTLMSLAPDPSEAGRAFAEAALAGAQRCDLGGLADRKLAKHVGGGGLELAPAIRMIADALAHADSVEESGGGGGSWVVRSRWVTLRCERYPYQDGHLRVIPLKEGCQ